MTCARCGTANPEAAKFCLNCGSPLAGRCVSCGAELAPAARFCVSCGQPVGASTASEEVRLERLAAAMPAPLAEKVRASPLAGERRVVTALFADVVGSTMLAEQLDAEDWTEIMNGAFDRISRPIYRYEGTIARLMGDAILAFFGAPVAHEDDPVRAVHAAIELLAAARAYAEEVRRRHGIDFRMRAGLNTGPVVVGAVGSDLKFEYTAMGDAVNLAARMEAAARPGTVLISEYTQRFVAPFFQCNDLGPVEVKGKSEPVRVFEVAGVKQRPGRSRGLAGLESPLVGREAELAALRRLSAGLASGKGAGVLIVGEPGLGKSRLVAEWQAAALADEELTAPDPASAAGAPAREMRWIEARCLSYGQAQAYHLLSNLLRGWLGLPEGAAEPELRKGLQEASTQVLGAEAPEIFPFLGHLLSIKLEGEAAKRVQALDPQALQACYLEAVRRLLVALAARQPVVLVLDDIHWADPSSIDLLGQLLGLAAEAPLLFALVTRPDAEAPGWRLAAAARAALGDRFSELQLGALTVEETRALVTNLLEVEALPAASRDIILQKSEGNPFFVEEVIRMLIDRGALVRQGNSWVAGEALDRIEIPDNLQGLLLARIDRLPEEAKRALRVAAVIGRQFPVRVLEQVLKESGA
jgi:class 3 adenylate cyclase